MRNDLTTDFIENQELAFELREKIINVDALKKYLEFKHGKQKYDFQKFSYDVGKLIKKINKNNSKKTIKDVAEFVGKQKTLVDLSFDEIDSIVWMFGEQMGRVFGDSDTNNANYYYFMAKIEKAESLNIFRLAVEYSKSFEEFLNNIKDKNLFRTCESLSTTEDK